LATKSLLSKYSISYRYSLLLVEQTPRKNELNKSFIAFAPGFTDQMKAVYRDANTGSAQIDNSYLSLLPQPFTISLAERIQNQLGGNTFKYEQSTLNAFRSNAGNHKIIHIGTHAESDNLHPEFSRIIFAKDGAETGEGNSLYLFDIYDCELSSYLTVLTACETGKPGYQDGEGMISVAHAFSYAGSESIITGLWKIDEQSSAQIMENFYRNILRGMDKDEALRNAKLDYLSHANGRTLAPQYWAGLVLMGDTSPVIIQNNNSKAYLLIALILILLLGGYLIVRKRRL
jgi:CHAT domain-containing protein